MINRKKTWGPLTPEEFIRRMTPIMRKAKNTKDERVIATLVRKNAALWKEYLRQHCPYKVCDEIMLWNIEALEYDMWEIIRIDPPEIDWKASVVTIPVTLTCLNPIRPQPDKVLTTDDIYQLTKTNQPMSGT